MLGNEQKKKGKTRRKCKRGGSSGSLTRPPPLLLSLSLLPPLTHQKCQPSPTSTHALLMRGEPQWSLVHDPFTANRHSPLCSTCRGETELGSHVSLASKHHPHAEIWPLLLHSTSPINLGVEFNPNHPQTSSNLGARVRF